MLFRLRAVAISLVVLSLTQGCGGDDPGPKSASIRVPANSTSALVLAGPDGTQIDVPAGASSTDVMITVTALPPSRRPSMAATVVGPGVQMSPEGQTFQKALEITIPITPGSLPAGSTIDDVVVVRAPQGSDAFVPLPTRRNGNAVVASTEHFSDFIPVVVAPGAFGSCANTMCEPNESCGSCPIDCGLCFATVDTTPPTVVGTMPTDGAIDLLGDAVVSLTFDEPILPNSVAATTISVMAGTATVTGTWTVQGATATFVPTPSWPQAAHVVVTASAVRDLAGNLMATPKSLAFDTAAGAYSSGFSPSDGSTGVAQGMPLVGNYVGPLDSASFTVQAADGPCTGTVQFGTDPTFASCLGGMIQAYGGATDSYFMLNPASALPAGATITWRVLGGARDGAHFSLATPAPLSFTVGPDVTSPRLLSTTPLVSAIDVDRMATVSFTFDEAIDPATVNGSNVSVTDGEGYYQGTLSVSGGTVTFTPTNPFMTGGRVYVGWHSLTDVAGNPAPDDGFSFDVLDFTQIATASPAGGAVGVHPRQDLVFTFSRNIVPATFTMQATDGPCTGTVQVSADYFSSCMGGTIVVSTGGITIRPTNDMPLLAYVGVSLTGDDVIGAGIDPNGLSFRVSPVNGFVYKMTTGPTTTGDIGGVAAADALCNGSFPGSKAFLGAPTRYPCDVDDCGAGFTSMDWVLSANTTYVNDFGDVLFTTRPTAPVFDYPLVNGLTSSGSSGPSGLNALWRLDGNDCAGWTDPAGTMSYGANASIDATFMNVSTFNCGSSITLRCVEIPPTALPSTH